jgi:hypothetical protein
MKIFVTIFAFYFSSPSYGQKNTIGYFKTTYFLNLTKAPKERIDTITITEHLDVHFYKKHFSVPYYIPGSFFDKRYKNTAIITWNDTIKKKNIQDNWTYTSTFDSLSRVTKYEYSGCLLCSQIPNQSTFFYDAQNRLVTIENRNDEPVGAKKSRQSKASTSEPSEEIDFKYDSGENIIQIKKWSYKKLELQIEITNIKYANY